LVAGQRLNFASCRGVWSERSCPKSATAIHSGPWVQHPTFQSRDEHSTTKLLPPHAFENKK